MTSAKRQRQIQRGNAQAFAEQARRLRARGFFDAPTRSDDTIRDIAPEVIEGIMFELSMPCEMLKTGDDAMPLRAFVTREGLDALSVLFVCWRIVSGRYSKLTCTGLAKILKLRPELLQELSTAYRLDATEEGMRGIVVSWFPECEP